VPESGLRAALLDRLEARRSRVAVIGLGYVGLPLAVAAARAGHTVAGIDADPARVATVNRGRSHIEDIEDSAVAGLVGERRLSASTSYSAAAGCDVAVIAVPTPIDRHRVPNLSYVRSAAGSIAAALAPGSLVVLESTTYPGTTEEVLVPALEQRGLRPGHDVFVGYSPERIDPSNGHFTIANTPKVIAGLTEDCLQAAAAFYTTFVERLVPVSSLKAAEITKLFENIFRVVNIALANEFQVICDRFGIDVWEVIDACSTKPYGYMAFYPGPGLGGHCVPVDPFYLAWKAREVSAQTEFIELAGRINAAVPDYVVGKIAWALNGRQRSLAGSSVGVLGVAYKKNTSDVRESPAVPIVEQLLAAGAAVSYHDPHVPMFPIKGDQLRSQSLTAEYLAALDSVVIIADHDAIDWALVVANAKTVVDTRNAFKRVSPFTAPLVGGGSSWPPTVGTDSRNGPFEARPSAS
jgi:UDP-N-acetyl-D-glucosamine dehydrogenase